MPSSRSPWLAACAPPASTCTAAGLAAGSKAAPPSWPPASLHLIALSQLPNSFLQGHSKRAVTL